MAIPVDQTAATLNACLGGTSNITNVGCGEPSCGAPPTHGRSRLLAPRPGHRARAGMPIAAIAREAGCVKAQHGANLTCAQPCHQPLGAGACGKPLAERPRSLTVAIWHRDKPWYRPRFV